MISTLQKPKVEKIILHDDGTFPNNASLPLVIYRNTLQNLDPAHIVQTFKEHNWVNAWHDGLYDYHHYHSTAHEALAVYKGSAVVLFGGQQGIQMELNERDVAVIPAGVAHKCIHSSGDFKCVGAYPKGQVWDMNYGKANERPEKDKNIRRLPIPQNDPVYGINGPLMEAWSGKPEPVIYGVSKENAYRRELENQLEDSTQLKNSFVQLNNTYKRGFIDKWFTGGIVFIFECIFYLVFAVFAVTTIMVLFDDAFIISMNEALLSWSLTPQDAALSLTIGKVILVIVSLFWLSIGLMLRGIRIRNGWIDNMVAEVNRGIHKEEVREKRIRKVL